uniref:ATP synthase subunit a n=1 Tax=Halice sp. JL-2018 TaxID=2528348 RepID=A0A3S8IF81_9CRUS|nr:ATP synthase F0 subunit 6 [Halice sp. JL-2018]
MMSNLFSIFDPSTTFFLSLNLCSTVIFLLFFPSLVMVMSSRYSSFYFGLLNYLKSEYLPLSLKVPYFVLFFVSLFMFIMFNNVLGLFPYIFTATSHMSFSLALALPLWLGLMFYGWSSNMYNLFAHLIPVGTPAVLVSFMVLIETVSNIIRPGTLAIRLSANMVAGHLLITLLSSSTPITPWGVLPLLVGAQLALSMLEIAVAMIQAYVFSILITLYTNEVI